MSKIKRQLSTAARRAHPLISGAHSAEQAVAMVLREHAGFWRRAMSFAGLILVLNRANRPELARSVILAMSRLW